MRWTLILLAGCAAPATELPAVDGSWMSLEETRGRVTVLNFWAEWCGSCEGELRQFNAMAAEHPDVAFVAVAHASGSLQDVRAFAERAGLTIPVLLGDGAVEERYGISVFPTTLILEPDGRIRHRVFGPRERDVWEELICRADPRR